MDTSCYGTYMRMAKPYAMRIPLENCQGNCGTIITSGDEAHMRYTELKLAEITKYLYSGIEKNTVSEWKQNFDESEVYPSVMPSIGYYNIVNGTLGLGIAISSSIPSFNLKETNQAIISLIKNPNLSAEEVVVMPDFPTGGIIINKNEVKEALINGTGKACRIRAKLAYNPDSNSIIVTEIPYSVYTSTITKELKDLIEENENYGVEGISDDSGFSPNYEIQLKKGVNPNKMIKKLYKDTSLESFYSINMWALDEGRFPKIFGLKDFYMAYIAHIRSCKRREIQFDLDKALTRENVVEGLILAAANIDEVVSIIRASSNPAEASQKLIDRFSFNEEQTKAILAMKLSSLTKIDAIKLDNEREELLKKIEDFHYLLDNPSALDEQLIKVLQEVADKFGDERRTKVLNLVEQDGDEEEKEEIKEEDIAVMLFDNNTIRLVKTEDLNGSKRGKKGVNVKPPKNANLTNTIYTTNLSSISAFTTKGRMYSFDIFELEYNNDYSIYELIQLQDEEKVLMLIDSNSFSNYKYILFITKQGLIKKSKTTEYSNRHKKGQVAIKLKEDDSIVNVFLSSNEKDRIMIASNSGCAVFYNHEEISAIGRVSQGIKAIKLKDNEYVAAATIVKENLSYKGILSISSSGKGKITKVEDYNETSRAIKGSLVQKLEDGEELSTVYAVPEEQEKMFVSANNKAVILLSKDIPVQGKLTSGVRIIDIRGTNSKVEVM